MDHGWCNTSWDISKSQLKMYKVNLTIECKEEKNKWTAQVTIETDRAISRYTVTQLFLSEIPGLIFQHVPQKLKNKGKYTYIINVTSPQGTTVEGFIFKQLLSALTSV